MDKKARLSRHSILAVILLVSAACLACALQGSVRLSTLSLDSLSVSSSTKTQDVAEVQPDRQFSNPHTALETKISDDVRIGSAPSFTKELESPQLKNYEKALASSSNDTQDEVIAIKETSKNVKVASEADGEKAEQEKTVLEKAEIPVSASVDVNVSETSSADVKGKAAEDQSPMKHDSEFDRYGGWIPATVPEDIFRAYNGCLLEKGPRCNMDSPTWNNYAWAGNPRAASDGDIRSLAAQHLRGKKIVLIGDSLMRYQFMSFTCLLSSLGFSLVRSEDGTCSEFPEIDFKVCYPERMYFIVRSSTNMKTVRHKFKSTIEECPTYMVINTGAHWSEASLQRECNGDPEACGRAGFNDSIGVYGRALGAIASFIKKFHASKSEENSDWCKSSGRTPTIIFQTSTVSHFDNLRFVPGRGVVGKADCDSKTSPSTSEELKKFGTLPEFVQQERVMRSWHRSTNWKNVATMLVDVTPLSLHRSDAHPGQGVDCLHFCLPGVPDWINRVLLNRIFRHEAHRSPQ